MYKQLRRALRTFNDENVPASSTYFTSQSPTHPAPERPNAWLRFNQVISKAQNSFHICVEKHLGLMALESRSIIKKCSDNNNSRNCRNLQGFYL